MQSKATEEYFSAALALPPGEIYLSDIDFNREHGVIAEPRVQVIRIAMPIYLERQEVAAGFVIINVNLDRVFSKLINSEQSGDRDLITDEKGRLLAFRDSSFNQGDDDNHYIQPRYPFLADLFKQAKQDIPFSGKISSDGEQLYVHLQSTSISERDPQRAIVLVEILPAAYIEQQIRPVLNQTFLAILILILLSIPIALLLVRKIIQPLNILTGSMERFAAGDKQVDIEVTNIHEINLLSNTFSQMREQVVSREVALAEAEERTRNIVDHIADGIIAVDEQGRICSLNNAAQSIFGHGADEILGKNVSMLMPEPFRSQHDSYIKEYCAGGGGHTIGVTREFPALHRDGHTFPIELTLTVAKQGSERVFIGLIRDVTERKRAAQQELLASKVMESSLESIVITDAKNRIQYVNPAFVDITGYSFEEALGQNPSFLSSGRHDGSFYKNMWDTLHNAGSWQGEIWDRRKDGSLYLKWLSISVIENVKNEITHYVGIASDITERKQTEERFKDLAHHDQLTGLPNRQLFNDRLNHAIIQSSRTKTVLALLFIDLDRFKVVNDTLGHEVGDTLLIEVANRISDKVRGGDTVARLGGDEFVLILPDIKTASNAAHVAQSLIDSINQPVVVDDHDCSIGASIGISFYPDDGADSSTLLRYADIAMYRAKSIGGSSFCLFDKQMEDEAGRRLALEMRLRKAINEEQFFLNYQPLVSGKSGRPIAFEALIRWHAPGIGIVAPDEFIPLSEETGQIIEIGEWVLEAACRQLVEWRTLGLNVIPVAVNISTRQLLEKEFVSHIKKLLKRYRLDAEFLELELTESTLMKYPDEAEKVLTECSKLGIRISIDDFGTGYSSLAYLKHLPVNKLKIDRSFISHITEDSRVQAIVTSVIHLAHSLGMQVVAEGVETQEQLNQLQALDCELLQGFLFSKPVSAEVAAEILTDSRIYCSVD